MFSSSAYDTRNANTHVTRITTAIYSLAQSILCYFACAPTEKTTTTIIACSFMERTTKNKIYENYNTHRDRDRESKASKNKNIKSANCVKSIFN